MDNEEWPMVGSVAAPNSRNAREAPLEEIVDAGNLNLNCLMQQYVTGGFR